MSNLRNLDLGSALGEYVISNTPLFLLSKLKVNPATIHASRFDSRDILRNIRLLLKVKPKELDGYVRPYVYLVALFIKRDMTAIRTARNIEAPHHLWFTTIARTIETTMIPTKIVAAHREQADQISIRETSHEPTISRSSATKSIVVDLS